MKVLILKNRFSTSLKSVTNEVKDFFSKLYDIEFTEERCNLKIVNSEHKTFDYSNKIISYTAIDDNWYDENISKPAKERGFDRVILLLKNSDWKSDIVGGFANLISNLGIGEISAKYVNSGKYNFGGVYLSGNPLKWVIIHEMLHLDYIDNKLLDNTHKYFLDGNPNKCLTDFMKIAILTRQKGDDKQTLGELYCNNGEKEFKCKTLELSWKDNKTNISCIPKGVYKVKMINSVKYGMVYEVKDVKERTAIYIHHGNFYTDIKGCILVGKDYVDINSDGYKDINYSKLTRTQLEQFFNSQDFVLIIKSVI